MASKRRVRRRACEVKVRHLTHSAAWYAAKMAQGNAMPYKCAFGEHWHIGHRSLKQEKLPKGVYA